MSTLSTLYRGETTIGFVGQARRWFIVSGVALVLCLASLAIQRLNLSLDFTGGTAIVMPNPAGASVGEVRASLGATGGAARIQLIDDGEAVRVQTEAIDLETEQQIVRSLVNVTGTVIELTDVESVGPTFGRQIAGRAVQALGVFLAVVVVFISIRFEWKMAVGAIAALLHDLIITSGAYSLLRFEVTPATAVSGSGKAASSRPRATDWARASAASAKGRVSARPGTGQPGSGMRGHSMRSAPALACR